MDSDSTTAYARYFQSDSFEISDPTGSVNSRIALWMSFLVEAGSLSLGVYSDEIQAYTHNFDSRDPSAVQPWIAQVESDYAVRVPQHFQQLPAKYLELVRDSFGISVCLDSGSECEYCGVNQDTVEAFYFPPLTTGGEASLGVYSRVGCYGSIEVYGNPQEAAVTEEALELLGTSWDSISTDEREEYYAELQESREAILDFVVKLKTVTALD